MDQAGHREVIGDDSVRLEDGDELQTCCRLTPRSLFTGVTPLMPSLRRWARLPRDEYAQRERKAGGS